MISILQNNFIVIIIINIVILNLVSRLIVILII